MADQTSAQPEQPGKLPPEKPAAPPPESRPSEPPPEKIVPASPGERSEGSPAPSSPEPPAEAPSQDELPPEGSGSFPSPFEEDIGYEIVEPPEEESDDGFASIPPGPTEEVSFEPPRARGPRRRRDRAQREAARVGAPAYEREPPAKPFPIWLAVAGVVLLAAIVIVLILLARGAR